LQANGVEKWAAVEKTIYIRRIDRGGGKMVREVNGGSSAESWVSFQVVTWKNGARNRLGQTEKQTASRARQKWQ
jgi:hypothetical protein